MNFKSLLPHLLSLVVILLINVIYFYPELEGKKLQQVDLMSSRGRSAEHMHYKSITGKEYLWTNGHFSGMPRLVGARIKNNLIYPVYNVVKLGIPDPIGMFVALMILYYLMLVLLGLSPMLSLVLAVGMGLCTSNLQLWAAGHASKIRTLLFTPLLISGLIYLFEKNKYLAGGLFLILGFTFSIYTRHPQMTYYLLLAFAVYGVIKLVRAIREKKLKSLILPVGIVIGSVILGLGASASRMWSMYEYSRSSMRGKPVLEVTQQAGQPLSSSQVEGLDWEYAMAWSNSTLDVLAGYIPGLVGGGSGEKVSTRSATYRTYRLNQAPLYWGGLPFTEGPIYFGAIFVFLFVFGLFYVRGDLKWWLGISMLMMILLSMGKNLEFLNRFLFDNLPMYNKFRTPQSILNAAVFFTPLLGALALKQLWDDQSSLKVGKKSKKLIIPDRFVKSLKWTLIICGGVAAFFAILGPSVFSFDSPGDQRYVQQGADIAPFITDRKSMMRSDSFRTLILVGLTGGLLWMFMKKRISSLAFIGILGALIIFDVWSVGNRYLSHDEYIAPNIYEATFAPRPVDQQILSQEKGREFYRVLDLSINTFNSAMTSVHHNTIGGYDPAKLQRYQDLIDRHITQNNQAVLDMLNTKYVIGQGSNNQPTLSVNPGALGNAWFVDQIQKVNTPNEEIDALTRFNPIGTAVVLDAEFENYIGDFDPVKDFGGTIELVNYEPDHLTYQTNANGEQLAVFSEIWYSPGWQAYIDGNPVDHIRANYALRALRVPGGSHRVEFVFKPRSYYMGGTIALVSSLVILGLVGMAVYRYWTTRPLAQERVDEEVVVKKKTTRSKKS